MRRLTRNASLSLTRVTSPYMILSILGYGGPEYPQPKDLLSKVAGHPQQQAGPITMGTVEGKAQVTYVRCESGQSSNPPCQPLRLLLRLCALHSLHGSYLVGVGRNSSLADHIAKEVSSGHSEDALIRVEP
ncbi:hypothetical protein LIER_27301 [Lithospermum erythrorhizon]|uniref:Uncharacterized protein n=1 Tax=Lithospermum erythrorhizon TaxID=34254 RepID=A0AAV3RFL5_LITER